MSLFDCFRRPPRTVVDPKTRRRACPAHEELAELVVNELRAAQLGPEAFVPDPRRLSRPDIDPQIGALQALGLPPQLETTETSAQNRVFEINERVFDPIPASVDDLELLEALRRLGEAPNEAPDAQN